MTTITDDTDLIDITPDADEAELIALFETLTNKTLYPGQSERIMLSVIAYRSNLNKIQTNEALKKIFLRWATGIFLDLWGEMVGCERLSAKQGVTMLKFTQYEIADVDRFIPAGTEVETGDGLYVFKTDSDLVISAGNLYNSVSATSELAGVALNAYAINTITNPIKNYEYIETVTNTVAVSGGRDEETDEDYKIRLYKAPEAFSACGSEGAYEYFAKSAHQDVKDVKVYSFSAGTVNICVLATYGEPTQSLLNAVSLACSASDKRPLTDNVVVIGATKVTGSVDYTVTLTKNADYTTTVTAITTALNAYYTSLKQQLNLPILETDIIKNIKNVSGVYDVVINLPNITLTADKTKYFDLSTGKMTIVRAE